MTDSAIQAANDIADLIESRILRTQRVIRQEIKRDNQDLLEKTILPSVSKMNVSTAIIAGGAAILGSIVGAAIAKHFSQIPEEDYEYGQGNDYED